MPTYIKVTSKRDGFRRAGRAWSKAPVEVAADEFTKEQLAALKSEPMLKVEIVEHDAEPPAAKKKATAKKKAATKKAD